MTEILNLNKQRKANARTQKETLAAQNRLKYGRTKQEKLAEKLEAEKRERHLQSHKLETKEE